MAEPLHIQAPDPMSALFLRHRLNAMNLDADMIPVGEVWDVRVFISGDDVAVAVQGLLEKEGIPASSSLRRARDRPHRVTRRVSIPLCS